MGVAPLAWMHGLLHLFVGLPSATGEVYVNSDGATESQRDARSKPNGPAGPATGDVDASEGFATFGAVGAQSQVSTRLRDRSES